MLRSFVPAIGLLFLSAPPSPAPPPPVVERPAVAEWAAFSPEGRRLLVTNPNGGIRPVCGIYTLPEFTEDKRFARPLYGSARPIAFVGTDRVLALWSDKQYEPGDLVLYDLTARKKIVTLEEKCRHFRCAAVAPDFKSALIGYDGRVVKHFDLTTGKLSRTLGEPADPNYSGHIVSNVGFADGVKKAWAEVNDGGKLWDLATGKEQPLPKIDEGHRLKAVSPDGKLLLTFEWTSAAREEFAAAIWDLNTGKKRFDFTEQWPLSPPVFMPDSKHLICCGQYGKMRKWDMTTGKSVLTLIMHLLKENNAAAAAVSPDGKWAVTSTHNGMLKLWDLQKERFARLLMADARFEIDDLVLADLKALAKDADTPVRLQAVIDLMKLGKVATSALEERSKDANALVRVTAAKGLHDVGEKEKSLVVWKAEIGNRDAVVRTRVATALRPDDDDSLPLLLGALTDKDSGVRRAAIRQIQHHLQWVKPGVRDALRKALGDDDPGVRVLAAHRLWFPIGVMLDEKSATMRALDDTQPARFATIAAEALTDSDQKIRFAAGHLIDNLADHGTKALDDVKDDLRRALKNKDPWVQLAAAKGLIALNRHTDEVVAAIAGILQSDQRLDYVSTCLNRLDKLGPKAKAAIPALIAILGSDGGPPSTLAKIGPDVMPAIVKVLDGNNTEQLLGAVSVCWHLGPQAKDAVPGLVRALKDLKVVAFDGRAHIAETLGRIGPDASDAVPALIEHIKDPKEPDALRSSIIQALAKLGPKAKDAVPVLKELAGHKVLGETAKQALRGLGE